MGYWRYYSSAKPKAVDGGLKAKSRRGRIGETWWSKRWIDVLESFEMGARLSRGRSYARKGQVISIDVEKGLVRARVQGTRSKPYDVNIKLRPIEDSSWISAEAAMASRAVFAAKLLSGEMPREIEEAFVEAGVSLFPRHKRDLETDCSCPDWANPCKHIAAVYYLLAEMFDVDPFLIFKLRGRTKEETLKALRELRASFSGTKGALDEVAAGKDDVDSSRLAKGRPWPSEDYLRLYWTAGPGLGSLRYNPASSEVEGAVLKRLGESPFTVSGTSLSSLLKKAYRTAGLAAMEKAYGGPEQAGEDEEQI